MSKQGIEALQAEREEILDVARTLTDDEWAAPSDCDGWTVKDVVAHVSLVSRQIADPASVPTGETDDIENDIELAVATMKSASPVEVVDAYEEWSAKGLDALAAMQDPPMGDTMLPLKNLGTHPIHLLADALTFDDYCHLRHDILKPNGPVERTIAPPDALRMQPIMTWMLAGLPQMNADVLAELLTAPVALKLDGPGGGEWTVTTDGVSEGSNEAAATIRSTTTDFVVWASGRRPWRDFGVELAGDPALATAVLDGIRVF
jgi:hypothetical protein